MQDMDNGARGWLLRTAHKNFWRVASYYEFEDLVQDGYLHYARIVQRYQHAKDRAHIMRIFQITYTNHLHDIAKKRTKQVDVPVSSILSDDFSEVDFFERHGGVEEDYSNLLLAPQPVRTALRGLGSEKGQRALKAKRRKRLNGSRETTNQRLCRVTGLDPSVFDLHSILRTYLKPAV